MRGLINSLPRHRNGCLGAALLAPQGALRHCDQKQVVLLQSSEQLYSRLFKDWR
jgi:hypothetical protein